MKHLLYYTHSFIHVKVFVLNPILSSVFITLISLKILCMKGALLIQRVKLKAVS